MPMIPLAGSDRSTMPGARDAGPADPNERIEVSIIVRRRNAAGMRSRIADPMRRDEFAREHGAAATDLAQVRDFARAHGLDVVSEHAARRTVKLAGTLADLSAAFAVELRLMELGGVQYRGRTGRLSLPDDCAGVIEAVLGLDNRPQSDTHFRIFDPRTPGASAAAVSYTPLQVAALYNFPQGDGAGECIALIELGGGFRTDDLETYFGKLGVATPTVTAVSVDKATNSPTGSADGPDGEVMLDIEVAGSIASGAKIAVYFAPNTDAGFLNAITTAIHDSENAPSVISISWGGPESGWTAQAMHAMDEAFQSAAALGITVCVASGDNGSSDGVASGDQVDFPASSSYALGCGGTSLRAASSSGALSEAVWDDGAAGGASGGGVSTVFPLPSWQTGLSSRTTAGKSQPLSMRGVPDVAGDADPETGYSVRVDGGDTVIGGTSAVAPLWAALIARINQARGKSVGYINPQLYANPKGLRDITQGNNGDFAAQAGWDACTGLGSPNGSTLPGFL